MQIFQRTTHPAGRMDCLGQQRAAGSRMRAENERPVRRPVASRIVDAIAGQVVWVTRIVRHHTAAIALSRTHAASVAATSARRSYRRGYDSENEGTASTRRPTAAHDRATRAVSRGLKHIICAPARTAASLGLMR